MVRKFYKVILAIVALLIICPVIGDAQSDNGIIKVTGDKYAPPNSYTDDNGIQSGYCIEIFNAIADAVDMKFELKLTSWNDARKSLEQGQSDVLLGMIYSEERDKTFDFSQPYHTVLNGIYALEGSDIKSLNDLKSRKIAVLNGGIMHDYLLNNDTGAIIITVETQAEAWRMVLEGESDCCLGAIAQGLVNVGENLIPEGIVTVGKPLLRLNMCFAVGEGDTELQKKINSGLDIINMSGAFRNIHQRWFIDIETSGISFKSIVKYSTIILGPILLLVIILFLWSWSLKRQVKQRTESLRVSEEKYRVLFETTRDALMLTEPGGRIVDANSSWLELYGYEREEAVGANILMVYIKPEDRDIILREFETKGYIHDYEIVHRRKDGKKIVCLLTANIRRAEDGSELYYQTNVRDITRQRQLEQGFIQAQKMESVGRLAGSVAHDFNNMLAVIIGYSEMTLEQVDTSSPLHMGLTEIFKAAKRSADLTRQLLAFARKQTISPVVLDLNNTVSGMLNMLRRLIGEDVDLVWIPGASLWTVMMDPGQVDQLLANLCVNSRDAITGVGKITIETENTTIDEEYCTDHTGFSPGNYVKLSVSDNGCGMEEETLEMVFDPFFTTKDKGEGTGLGLSTVYGVVKQNDGFINVYSEPDYGTTFKIYLPQFAGSAKKHSVDGHVEPDAHGHETVLIVEDEPAILKLGIKMLEKLGYHVLAANTPGKAIELAENHSNEIHLLLTDVVMPDMNGRELANRILSLYPNIKLLFMSGYTANVIAHHGVLEEGVQFIQKPFSKKDFANKMRELLD